MMSICLWNYWIYTEYFIIILPSVERLSYTLTSTLAVPTLDTNTVAPNIHNLNLISNYNLDIMSNLSFCN